MKLSKFLSLIGLITLLSCLYVYQQTQILCLAYTGGKKLATLEDLLDKNSILRYNTGKSASLVRIGNKISTGADYEMPGRYRLLSLAVPQENLKAGRQAFKKENLFARIFGIKRQAEAKTINP